MPRVPDVPWPRDAPPTARKHGLPLHLLDDREVKKLADELNAAVRMREDAAWAAQCMSIDVMTDGYGVSVYDERRSQPFCWVDQAPTMRVVTLPAAMRGAAFAAMWVENAAGTDRLGFEYHAATNELALVGQAGPGFAPIGDTVTMPYLRTRMAWWRLRDTGSAICWDTSADGRHWKTYRALTDPPAWTTDPDVHLLLRGYRVSGPNDTFVVRDVQPPAD